MNIPNPHMQNPTMQPAQAPGQGAQNKSSVWDYIAPLIGGVAGGFITHQMFGGESILTTLIGAGVGALLGGVVKGWIAPKDTQVQAPHTPGLTPPQVGGPQPQLGMEQTPSMEQLAQLNAERAKQANAGFDAARAGYPGAPAPRKPGGIPGRP